MARDRCFASILLSRTSPSNSLVAKRELRGFQNLGGLIQLLLGGNPLVRNATRQVFCLDSFVRNTSKQLLCGSPLFFGNDVNSLTMKPAETVRREVIYARSDRCISVKQLLKTSCFGILKFYEALMPFACLLYDVFMAARFIQM